MRTAFGSTVKDGTCDTKARHVALSGVSGCLREYVGIGGIIRNFTEIRGDEQRLTNHIICSKIRSARTTSGSVLIEYASAADKSLSLVSQTDMAKANTGRIDRVAYELDAGLF